MLIDLADCSTSVRVLRQKPPGVSATLTCISRTSLLLRKSKSLCACTSSYCDILSLSPYPQHSPGKQCMLMYNEQVYTRRSIGPDMAAKHEGNYVQCDYQQSTSIFSKASGEGQQRRHSEVLCLQVWAKMPIRPAEESQNRKVTRRPDTSGARATCISAFLRPVCSFAFLASCLLLEAVLPEAGLSLALCMHRKCTSSRATACWPCELHRLQPGS